MSIFDKIKGKKEAKQATIAEELRFKKVAEKCEKDFEAYKMLTMATQAKIGTMETRCIEEEQRRINATIAYSEYGPIVKREIYLAKEDGSYLDYVSYTTYEGYLKPSENQNDLSGYFKINHKVRGVSNPVDRETFVFQKYDGVNRNALGEITEIKDTQQAHFHAGKYGAIIEQFEETIKNISEKMAQRQDVIEK